MQINSINNINTQPRFKAGKVRVFSDFDRTFLPSSHNDFKANFDIKYVNYIRDYFKNFKDFLYRTKEGLKFTITTGRTFGEFQTMAEISRERKFGMPLPDTFIAKNGSDEYIRTGSDEDFYNGGEFPFKYDVTNKEKEENIKKLTGWDGPKIKERIKDLFRSYNLRIVEGDSEHSPGDYGSKSLFAPGKIPYETNKIFHGTDKADWVIGFRNDGNCKIFITYPYDMYCVDERYKAYRYFEDEINKILHDEFHIKDARGEGSRGGHNDNCGGRPWDIYEPEVIEKSAQYNHDRGLSKLYDTREAVKLAKQNNNLVIAAGDSSNDALMLNPGLYLNDALEAYSQKHKFKPTWKTVPSQLIKMMDEDPDLAKAFQELPFIGVIVKDDEKFSSLKDLADAFSKGKYKKIVVVEKGHLEDGIKEAIKLYSKQNPQYKKNLNSALKKELARKDDPSSPKDDGNNPPMRR